MSGMDYFHFECKLCDKNVRAYRQEDRARVLVDMAVHLIGQHEDVILSWLEQQFSSDEPLTKMLDEWFAETAVDHA